MTEAPTTPPGDQIVIDDRTRKLFGWYRTLATVVGILLTALTLAVIFQLTSSSGSRVHDIADHTASVVGVLHGFLYMGYLVVAFFLARTLRWSLVQTLLMLVAGVLPLIIFFIEAAVVRRARAEHPDL